jgi:trans-aconitate methyltransferase
VSPDFDAMYAADPDPWSVRSSWYERRKLAVLLACLPHEHYARGWEPGCGIGVGTAALAARVGNLVASDGSPRAVAATRERTAALPHVRVLESRLPESPLEGPVDLVVAAEFLYYLDDLAAALATLWSTCAPGGHLVCVHWAHHPHDGHHSGVQLHGLLRQAAAEHDARHLVEHRDEDFVLDVFERPA